MRPSACALPPGSTATFDAHPRRWWRLAAAVALACALAGCGESPMSTLDPHGPAAAVIETLWWVMLWLSTIISIGVFALLAYALFHRNRAVRELPAVQSEPAALKWVLIGGVVLPLAVLVPLFIYNLWVMNEITPERADGELEVVVIGKQYWWEVRYPTPEGEIITANEIRIPTGRRVRVWLESPDVIHSFWVPELHGKMDLIPGRVTSTWIQADDPGVYRGVCAEYCGIQHAKMAFVVVAQPPEEFEAWLARERLPALPPADTLAAIGRAVYVGSACALCHHVRGVAEIAEVGIAPDLTHLASRLTLAAGTLPNTKGHLGGWIGNPQAIKPGNPMPYIPLDNEEFLALVHYLDGLR